MQDRLNFGRARVKMAFGLVLFGAVALIGAGCGGDDEGDGGAERGAPESFTITLPFQDSIAWPGYEISRGPEGPFEVDAGLRPKTVATEGNSFSAQQLIAGKVDYAVTGAPETIIANARGNELFGVAAVDSDIFAIAATDDSGVTSLEDLEGGALGVTDLGGGEIPLVNAALSDAGLEPGEDVELKVVGPGGAAAFKALESGEVAAFAGAYNDFVPLEGEGLSFNTILSDEFTNLPSDYLAVRPEVLDDEELRNQLIDFQKGWYEGVLYGEQYPEDGLARSCEQAPEDCQDMEFARGFYDAAMEAELEVARVGGCPDYEALETVRDAIAAADVPAAADVDVQSVFPDDVCQEMVPSEDDVEAFAERTGASE